MLFADAASQIESYRITRDGFLVADVRFARAGIYQYGGPELDRPDKAVVDVFRPASSVFSAAAMRSFAHKPVTVDHPSESVSAANWKQHAVGQIGDEIRRDGDFVRATLTIHDAAAIEAIKEGRQELSAGYRSSIAWHDGEANGARYDAIMSEITGNHVALVFRGRAGRQCRIGGAN